jgi:hypothetical protein
MPITKADFEKYTAAYEKEKAEYEALKPGQIIYKSSGYDNFEYEIVSVDVDNRIIATLDYGSGGKPINLTQGHWSVTPYSVM